MASLEFRGDLFVRGTDFKENYALLREFENTKWESFHKAWLVRVGVAVDFDPGISYSTAIWRQSHEWIRKWIETF